MSVLTRLLGASAAVLVIVGCSETSETGPGDSVQIGFAGPGSASADSASADSTNIVRLESEALALVHNEGCDSVAQCRIAPVGAKPCGGPRFWITFCSLTTDSTALFRKLEELRIAEQAFNQAHGIISDCSVVSPPNLVVSAGSCRAAP